MLLQRQDEINRLRGRINCYLDEIEKLEKEIKELEEEVD